MRGAVLMGLFRNHSRETFKKLIKLRASEFTTNGRMDYGPCYSLSFCVSYRGYNTTSAVAGMKTSEEAAMFGEDVFGDLIEMDLHPKP